MGFRPEWEVGGIERGVGAGGGGSSSSKKSIRVGEGRDPE
jgi:hypothetical protein